jgi:hypothetical protein
LLKVKPSVVNIYPTSDSIPVNILRFYIELSHPIQELGILNHIKLTTEDGRNITDVFLKINMSCGTMTEQKLH